MVRKTGIVWAAAACLLLAASATATVDPVIVNPGFEAGVDPWQMYDDGGQGNAVLDTTVSHTGSASGKLYLRWYGGTIEQYIACSLQAERELVLTWWMKMPEAGSESNKWFGALLVARASDGTVALAQFERFDPILEWTQQTLRVTPSFPVVQVRVYTTTGAGGGGYDGWDKPVWVDDFALTVVPEPSGVLALSGLLVSLVAPRLRRRT